MKFPHVVCRCPALALDVSVLGLVVMSLFIPLFVPDPVARLNGVCPGPVPAWPAGMAVAVSWPSMSIHDGPPTGPPLPLFTRQLTGQGFILAGCLQAARQSVGSSSNGMSSTTNGFPPFTYRVITPDPSSIALLTADLSFALTWDWAGRDETESPPYSRMEGISDVTAPGRPKQNEGGRGMSGNPDGRA